MIPKSGLPVFGQDHAHGDGRVAQLVEHLTFNQVVPGSSPGALTNKINDLSQIDRPGQNLRVCAVSAVALLSLVAWKKRKTDWRYLQIGPPAPVPPYFYARRRTAD